MKILLVCPKFSDHIPVGHPEDMDGGTSGITPLALYILAALTREDVDVSIVNENMGQMDFSEEVDLVGIHVMEHLAPRAKEIARRYRKRGVKVVMGGFYPTLIPDEAMEESDAIVVGEAEGIWGDLIRDFKAGKLQRVYKRDSYVDMRDVPIIRKRNIPNGHSLYQVETGRGCPNRCEYCSVTSFHGNRHRVRPIEDVIEQIQEIDSDLVSFVDDNIVGNVNYATELFGALRPLRKLWSAQCSINIAKSDALLRLAADSGCYLLVIGFESLRSEAMRELNKSWAEPDTYAAFVQKIHDAGISIIGTFMFGLDHDDKEVFEQTVSFCIENNIEYPDFHILRPFRGTRLGTRLLREGRVKKSDLEEVTTSKAHFDPLQMSRLELEEGWLWSWREVYSKKGMKNRLSHILPNSSLFNKRTRSPADNKTGPWKRGFTREDLIILLNMNTHYYFNEPKGFVR